MDKHRILLVRQINFDFERSGPFYKNADASHEIKKRNA